jgi:hypothetical protein
MMDPELGLYVPALQFVQLPLPAVFEYLPGTQVVHDVDPAFEKLPAAQLMHVAAEVAPVVVLNVPAMQLVQLPASAPEYVPAPHVVHEEEPAVEYVPALQDRQSEADDDPKLVLYFPAEHEMHDADPYPVW